MVCRPSPPVRTLTRPDDVDRYGYAIASELVYRPSHVGTVAVIKRVTALDSSRPFEGQLHVLNLFGPGGSGAEGETVSPYEAVHALVHLAVAPYFDAYVASRGGRREITATSAAGGGGKDADAKRGVPMAKKKFAELELSLLHLQQNVEIPDVHLSVHPAVQRAVERARADGVRLSPELIDPAILADSTFLNKIQGEVNSWIKEIQSVTKLNRDVASGTASQEINFWLSMERALEGIEEQLRSEPIVLTLDILKHAKRFHATVSFIADTGLKEATDIGPSANRLC